MYTLPHSIATEILALSSNSLKNHNDSNVMIAIPTWEDKSYIRYNGRNFYIVV